AKCGNPAMPGGLTVLAADGVGMRVEVAAPADSLISEPSAAAPIPAAVRVRNVRRFMASCKRSIERKSVIENSGESFVGRCLAGALKTDFRTDVAWAARPCLRWKTRAGRPCHRL